jgi:hypothetical protein
MVQVTDRCSLPADADRLVEGPGRLRILTGPSGGVDRSIAARYPADHREGRLRHHLGRALAGLGLIEEARRQWELALIQYQLVADVRAADVRTLLVESAEVQRPIDVAAVVSVAAG